MRCSLTKGISEKHDTEKIRPYIRIIIEITNELIMHESDNGSMKYCLRIKSSNITGKNSRVIAKNSLKKLKSCILLLFFIRRKNKIPIPQPVKSIPITMIA